MPSLYWEDFPAGSARRFGAMPVSREAVLAFARDFDPQRFHLDDAAAEASLFGRLSASGWHTCAMAMRMICDDYLLDSSSLGSPGMEKLQWRKPVHPGDTLGVQMQVLEARPMKSRPQVGLVRASWEVLNQHGDVVLSMEGWNMFGRRPAGARCPLCDGSGQVNNNGLGVTCPECTGSGQVAPPAGIPPALPAG